MLRCGLLGERLAHSFSPQIHAEFGGYEYVLYEKRPDEVEGFLLDGDFDGLNVTIPYKKAVMPFCASLSASAQAIGSVNTLVRLPGGGLYGDNTDYFGFERLLLRSGVDIAGEKAVVLGSGGASLTVQTVLKDRGAREVVVVSRGGGECDHLSRTEASPPVCPCSPLIEACTDDGQGRFGVAMQTSGEPSAAARGATVAGCGRGRTSMVNYGNLSEHKDAVLLVNTTPVGMYPGNGASPLPAPPGLRAFPGCRALIDLIYNPARTELMLDAEERGVPAFGGLLMLVAQAKKASEVFTGAADPDPNAEIERVTENILQSTLNLIFIGMPGSGKTSIGAALAERLGRRFVDCDAFVEEKAGKPIPKIFAEDGEAAFRSMESDILAEVCKESGLVVATGGGVVTKPGNKRLLAQNGVIVFLDREISLLPSDGRPLSEREGVARLAEARMPLYRGWADHIVKVESVEQAAEKIQGLLFEV